MKQRLKDLNISQAEIARKMKVTRSMVNQIVSGKTKVPLERMSEFERLTGIPRS